MTMHSLLKFIHVVGAVAWVGSGIGFYLYGRQLSRAGDKRGMLSLVQASDGLGKVLFMPAALLTIVSGIVIVAIEPAFRFSDAWIIIGIVGVVVSSIAQMRVAAPRWKEFRRVADESGGDSPELTRILPQLNSAGAVDVLVLLLVVWAMVMRPSF